MENERPVLNHGFTRDEQADMVSELTYLRHETAKETIGLRGFSTRYYELRNREQEIMDLLNPRFARI